MSKNLNTVLCFQPAAKYEGQINGDAPSIRYQEARKFAGLELKAAAEKLGVAPSLLGRIERGSAKDTKDSTLISRAASLYNVSAAWLYAGSNAPRSHWPVWFA